MTHVLLAGEPGTWDFFCASTPSSYPCPPGRETVPTKAGQRCRGRTSAVEELQVPLSPHLQGASAAWYLVVCQRLGALGGFQTHSAEALMLKSWLPRVVIHQKKKKKKRQSITPGASLRICKIASTNPVSLGVFFFSFFLFLCGKLFSVTTGRNQSLHSTHPSAETCFRLLSSSEGRQNPSQSPRCQKMEGFQCKRRDK